MPAHNVLIVAGDFNARIGIDIIMIMQNLLITQAQTEMENFCMSMRRRMTSSLLFTTFKKKTSKLWTCVLPSGVRAQLDYVLVRKKWRNIMNNAEAYNSFASIGSDDRLVTAKIRLSL